MERKDGDRERDLKKERKRCVSNKISMELAQCHYSFNICFTLSYVNMSINKKLYRP